MKIYSLLLGGLMEPPTKTGCPQSVGLYILLVILNSSSEFINTGPHSLPNTEIFRKNVQSSVMLRMLTP